MMWMFLQLNDLLTKKCFLLIIQVYGEKITITKRARNLGIYLNQDTRGTFDRRQLMAKTIWASAKIVIVLPIIHGLEQSKSRLLIAVVSSIVHFEVQVWLPFALLGRKTYSKKHGRYWHCVARLAQMARLSWQALTLEILKHRRDASHSLIQSSSGHGKTSRNLFQGLFQNLRRAQQLELWYLASWFVLSALKESYPIISL